MGLSARALSVDEARDLLTAIEEYVPAPEMPSKQSMAKLRRLAGLRLGERLDGSFRDGGDAAQIGGW